MGRRHPPYHNTPKLVHSSSSLPKKKGNGRTHFTAPPPKPFNHFPIQPQRERRGGTFVGARGEGAGAIWPHRRSCSTGGCRGQSFLNLVCVADCEYVFGCASSISVLGCGSREEVNRRQQGSEWDFFGGVGGGPEGFTFRATATATMTDGRTSHQQFPGYLASEYIKLDS